MAQYVLPFIATIPGGTPESAPVTVDLELDNWSIEQIDLEVPPGPAGLMGFQVYNNGVAWIPYGAGQWLVWDNTKESYYMTDQPNGSGWAIVGYNEGFYEHSVTVRFHVNPVAPIASTTAVPAVTFVTSDTPASESVTLAT